MAAVELTAGDFARVSGLSKRTDLNGQLVTLQGWDAAAGRWAGPVSFASITRTMGNFPKLGGGGGRAPAAAAPAAANAAAAPVRHAAGAYTFTVGQGVDEQLELLKKMDRRLQRIETDLGIKS